MKIKILWTIISIILIIWIWAIFASNYSENEEEITYEEDYLENLEQDLEETKNNTSWANQRMEDLRKKIELKWLITRWDLYFTNKEYTTALTQYLQVYRKVPWDREVNLKIWNIYYSLWNYNRAYDFFENIKDYGQLDKKKAIYSFVNSKNLTSSWTNQEINEEIDSFDFNNQENFYLKNSITCVNDFSLCRKKYQDFFNEVEQKNNENEEKIEYISELQTIKNAFDNYNNFQIDELNYKAALISWAYYSNWFYKISLETAKNILEENPEYKPLLKIAAKSSYELWNYIESRDFVIRYNKLEQKDPEMSYFAWRIYEKLNENVLSVINFSKAINIGYPDIADIKRRLIFIYFDMQDNEKMLKTFRELIELESDELNIRDYNLAVYYHILNDDLENATKISEIWKEKFPESELFYGYQTWIILQNEEINQIQERIIKTNIEKAKNINSENPMIAMVEWIYESKNQNYEDALGDFRKAIQYDSNKEYNETIEFWIERTMKEMNNKRKEEQNENNNNN